MSPLLKGESLRLLVVDDDPAVIYAARALLARRGCRVEAAFKGLDAVARVRAGGIDALLLDVEMPEVDGLSVLAELRALKLALPTVMMTQADAPLAREAVARGEAIALLRKPVDFGHAVTLLTGRPSEEPITLRLDPTRAAFATVRDALEGRPLQLAQEAPLPAGTAISLLVPNGSRKPLALPGTAEAGPVASQLQMRLAPLTAELRGALEAILHGPGLSAPRPPSRKTKPPAPPRARAVTPPQPAEALAGVHRARGLIRKARQLSDPREALVLLEEAIRLEPMRASTHLEAAQLWLQLGEDLERAEERIGAAIHLAPSDPVPRLHLTRLLERAGRHREAQWACDAALALFPGDRELQAAATRLRRRLGEPAEVAVAGSPRRASGS